MMGFLLPALLLLAAPPPFVGEVASLPAVLQQQMRTHSWRLGCPVPLAELRLVHVTHLDDQGQVRRGELVVHHRVAAEVLTIFRDLYNAGFPLRSVRLIEHYQGSDDASMAADNTSAFNCREVTGKPGVYSRHSWGLAIDVNPLRNPYVKGAVVEPAGGRAFVDRATHRPGMITRGDACHRAFVSRGWRWGGAWRSIKDYQHFEKRLR